VPATNGFSFSYVGTWHSYWTVVQNGKKSKISEPAGRLIATTKRVWSHLNTREAKRPFSKVMNARPSDTGGSAAAVQYCGSSTRSTLSENRQIWQLLLKDQREDDDHLLPLSIVSLGSLEEKAN